MVDVMCHGLQRLVPRWRLAMENLMCVCMRASMFESLRVHKAILGRMFTECLLSTCWVLLHPWGRIGVNRQLSFAAPSYHAHDA